MVGRALEGLTSKDAKFSKSQVVVGTLTPPGIMAIAIFLDSKIIVGLYLYLFHWLFLLTSMRFGLRGVALGWLLGTALMIFMLPLVAIEVFLE